MMIFIKLV